MSFTEKKSNGEFSLPRPSSEGDGVAMHFVMVRVRHMSSELGKSGGVLGV